MRKFCEVSLKRYRDDRLMWLRSSLLKNKTDFVWAYYAITS